MAQTVKNITKVPDQITIKIIILFKT
jgi:hypothetical protein